jgi:hypothetical protein
MHQILDAYGATGPAILRVLLSAPPYMPLVHCKGSVYCNISVYAGVAPPILGENVDSFDWQINTTNIAESAYAVTKHSAAMLQVTKHNPAMLLLCDYGAHRGVMASDCCIVCPIPGYLLDKRCLSFGRRKFNDLKVTVKSVV